MKRVSSVSKLGRLVRLAARPAAFAAALFLGLAAARAEGTAKPGDALGTAEISNAPSRWPMRLNTSEGQVTFYEPQLTAFSDDQMKTQAAVSIIKPGAQEPIFGAVWMVSRVSTDREARIVRVLDNTVTRVRFSDTDAPTEQFLTNALSDAIAQQPITLSLDQLLAMLEVVNKEKEVSRGLATQPPNIIFREHPTVLVPFEGEPLLTQVPDSNLMRVDNSPFFIALEPTTKTYYLKGAGYWFAAQSPKGPYHSVDHVPDSVFKLADSSGYTDPQTPIADAQVLGIEIVTATTPTELIWTSGPQKLSPIEGTGLLYVVNTTSNVFLEIQTQRLFVLLSGRWYSATNRSGPWVSVEPDKLPDDFQKIPADGPLGDVLAHVAGTPQARDAIADTHVPQTAAIDVHNYDPPPVSYDGPPKFVTIDGTQMTYAVNTTSSVVYVGGQFYCCFNAVWYMSASATGPWFLCTYVPADVYTIPPSCPIFPVRYCRVYEATDNYVYCGYLPGYIGSYAYHGVVVYGTGFHYSPWAGKRFYPRPATFGFGARYDAYSGHWGFNIGSSNDAGHVWIGAKSPHVDGWFGHAGYQPYIEPRFYDNRAAAHPPERIEFNLYDRRKDVHVEAHKDVVVVRNDAAEKDPHPNNVFVDKDGSVYRKTDNGWETRENNHWVSRPAPQPEPMKHEPGHEPGNDPGHNGPNHQAPIEGPHDPPNQGIHEAHQPPYQVPNNGSHDTPNHGTHEAHQVPPQVPNEGEHDGPKQGSNNTPPARPAPEPPNDDYHARVSGDDRRQAYHPAPPQEPSAPSKGGGGGGGYGGGGGGGGGDQPHHGGNGNSGNGGNSGSDNSGNNGNDHPGGRGGNQPDPGANPNPNDPNAPANGPGSKGHGGRG